MEPTCSRCLKPVPLDGFCRTRTGNRSSVCRACHNADVRRRRARGGGPASARDGGRFWAKVDKSGECWLWTAYRNPLGYGYVTINRRPRGAHRVAYELTHGPVPDDLFVCHRCDNPSCVRPDHLFLGTNDENMADMVAKGRSLRGRRPEAHLTEAQVMDLRRRWSAGAGPTALAREYGVKPGVIHSAVHGRTWSHLPLAARGLAAPALPKTG